jgi:hypothetical protein
MTKTPGSLQELRKRIYIKAKADKTWRFWGLYVHVCKIEVLQTAYEMAKQNNGAPGIDGVTLNPSKRRGGEHSWEAYGTNCSAAPIGPPATGKRKYPKGVAKSASWEFRRFAIGWFREHSSSYWSRSLKLIFKRGRMDTDRSEPLTRRYIGYQKQ